MPRKELPATLTEAIYEMIHHSDVPLRRQAEQMGIEQSTLTRYGLEGSSGAPIPAYRLMTLTAASKSFLAMDFLEKSVGRVAFQMPVVGQALTRDIAILTIQAMKEFADFLQEIEKALKNDSISPDECRKIQWECYHAIQKILELRAACEVHA